MYQGVFRKTLAISQMGGTLFRQGEGDGERIGDTDRFAVLDAGFPLGGTADHAQGFIVQGRIDPLQDLDFLDAAVRADRELEFDGPLDVGVSRILRVLQVLVDPLREKPQVRGPSALRSRCPPVISMVVPL